MRHPQRGRPGPPRCGRDCRSWGERRSTRRVRAGPGCPPEGNCRSFRLVSGSPHPWTPESVASGATGSMPGWRRGTPLTAAVGIRAGPCTQVTTQGSPVSVPYAQPASFCEAAEPSPSLSNGCLLPASDFHVPGFLVFCRASPELSAGVRQFDAPTWSHLRARCGLVNRGHCDRASFGSRGRHSVKSLAGTRARCRHGHIPHFSRAGASGPEPASGLGTLLPPDGVATKPLTISTNGVSGARRAAYR